MSPYDVANTLFDARQIPQAIAAYRQVLAANPNHAGAWNNLAGALAISGDFAGAEAAVRSALRFQPSFPEALNNLGNILNKLGRLEEAVAAYRGALALRPDYPTVLSNLGSTLADRQQFDDAITACRRAVDLQPNSPGAWRTLGSALRRGKRLGEALAALMHSLKLDPSVAATYNNLGSVYFDQANLDAAIESFRRAAALNPSDPIALRNLARALQEKGLAHDAIAVLRQSLSLNPNDAQAANLLGVCLYERVQLEQAIAAFRRAIALKADMTDAHNNLGIALKDTGQLDDAMAAYAAALRIDPNHSLALGNRIYTMNFEPGADPAAILRAHRDWNGRLAAPLKAFVKPHANDRSPDRILRIGYVSPDLWRHSVSFFLLPLLQERNPQAVHVTCYATSAKSDAVTDKLRSAADAWKNLLNVDDATAAERIRLDGIDILVDLSGHTSNNRLLLFARKPAPVQVTYLGYPATTGLETMDWRLTDSIADPPGAEELYIEKLYRLPRTAWCFAPLSGSPPARFPDHEKIVFGSFNDLSKVNPPLLQLWSQILHRLPDSTLLLKSRGTSSPSAAARICAEFEQQGINSARIQFLPYQNVSEAHLSCYDQIDVALDSYPYHGTTTTCEALWMGVPVVTLAGRSHVSRVGASLLHSVQLDDLVAHDAGQYVEIAADLAADRDRRRSLRGTLRQTMQNSPLMDGRGVAREIESAYRDMWLQWIKR
ncbi:MAG TPA: tetratricopeptide repeat protein [Tepidisphaeraceae bacterium]|nr:tetratricopeptide repeat protein [Tepidisphaeraceae bacterium]